MRMIYCLLKCKYYTIPNTLFVGGCACGSNIVLKLNLCTFKTLLFCPTVLDSKIGISFDFFVCLLTVFILFTKLSILRASAGSCMLTVNPRDATAHHLGLSRTFGPFKTVAKIIVDRVFVLSRLGKVATARHTRLPTRRLTTVRKRRLGTIAATCIMLNLIVLILLLTVQLAEVPGLDRGNRGVRFNTALHHLVGGGGCM